MKACGAAALTGEALAGFHSDGKYYLTKNKDEVAYYRKRAEALLQNAQPLMHIYRAEDVQEFKAFLLADAHTPGKRRSMLSALPLYTMDRQYLQQFLTRKGLAEADKLAILAYADASRQTVEEILKTETVTDEVACLSEAEFADYPMTLSLSGMFNEQDIYNTYEENPDH